MPTFYHFPPPSTSAPVSRRRREARTLRTAKRPMAYERRLGQRGQRVQRGQRDASPARSATQAKTIRSLPHREALHKRLQHTPLPQREASAKRPFEPFDPFEPFALTIPSKPQLNHRREAPLLSPTALRGSPSSASALNGEHHEADKARPQMRAGFQYSKKSTRHFDKPNDF